MAVYGFLKYSSCYHASPNCPVLEHVKKKIPIEIRSYEEEKSAYKSGHIRRCKLCLGDKVFDANEEKLVRLTKEQHKTLHGLISLHKEKGRTLTLKEIAEKRGKSVVATHLMLQRLIEQGLVRHEYSMGSRKAKNGSIAPTNKGLKIMKLEELD